MTKGGQMNLRQFLPLKIHFFILFHFKFDFKISCIIFLYNIIFLIREEEFL